MTAPDLRGLLPHSGGALLLDSIGKVDADTLTATVTVREHARFSGSQGVDAWIGLEYMAQAAAALAGYEAIDSGGDLRPGYLLGTRRYTSSHPRFPLGVSLLVRVHRDASSGSGVALYSCSIEGEGIMVDATVAVYQPEIANE